MNDSSYSKYLFISDVHLGGFSKKQNTQIEHELINLIDFCEDNEYQIVILGDLFDYWMEYPGHHPDLGENLLARFERYNRKRTQTLYITGNHDYWTNGYFHSIGFDVEKNKRNLTIDDTSIFLMHGDGLDNPALGLPRPLLHRFLRNPVVIKTFQSLFRPDTGLKIMKNFSRLSRSAEDEFLDRQKLNEWAKTYLGRSSADAVICGHDHIPRIKKNDFGTFINLGTFYKHRTVATYNKGSFDLVVWSDEFKMLKPFQSSIKTDE